ncbi:embryonic polyadenylate-binding protein 2 isoform X3 [Apteryx rowi]|uniref:embryonic polyadenylate-binding protein 2 isoform X3 n=1 Tax=Apteryx rowi TaxID=308060 RepID=UPI000E1D2C03|nr:embryonic polyadenylate-binding protein 2 isoform X3 [Apteryx rowi]
MAALQKAAEEDLDLSHLEGDSAEELGVQDPELEAIKARVREMEKEDERLKELQLEAESRFIMSSEAGLFPKTTEEKMEVDQRSIYVGNVDYGGTAEELESHFNSCGQINRVTILCDKFSGHPKGYAYIEFEEKSSVKAAVALDESMFRGRVIKGSGKTVALVFSILKGGLDHPSGANRTEMKRWDWRDLKKKNCPRQKKINFKTPSAWL